MKTRLKSCRRTLFAIFALAFVSIGLTMPQAVRASEILAHEDFEGLESGGLKGQGGGKGWNGVWSGNAGGDGVRVVILPDALDGSMSSARIHTGFGPAVHARTLDPKITVGGDEFTGTVYFGVTMRLSDEGHSEGFLGMGLGGTGGSILVGIDFANADWTLRARDKSGDNDVSFPSGIPFDQGGDHRVVVRLEYSGAGCQATVWVDPQDEDSHVALETPPDAITQNSMSAVSISVNHPESAFIERAFVDNFQISTTFGGAATVLVVEPQE